MQNYWQNESMNWDKSSLLIHMGPSVQAITNYFYIQEMGKFITNKGYYTERENLLSHLILYTTAGKGLLRYKEEEYSLTAGDVFFIDCRNYQYYTRKENKWDFYFVHFSGKQVEGYYQEYIRENLSPVTHTNGSYISEILRFLIENQNNLILENELWNSKYITDILTELISIRITRIQNITPEIIQTAKKYLETHYFSKITLEKMAEELAVSKSYLTKNFKRYYSYSPMDYLQQFRLNQSKTFLRYTDLSIEAISEKIGFYNSTHYIDQFKRKEGTTPGKYRRLWS